MTICPIVQRSARSGFTHKRLKVKRLNESKGKKEREKGYTIQLFFNSFSLSLPEYDFCCYYKILKIGKFGKERSSEVSEFRNMMLSLVFGKISWWVASHREVYARERSHGK